METKQIELRTNKSMLPFDSLQRLIGFVQNVEEKLASVKTIHEKLNELMFMVCQTHENILEELTQIKTVFTEAVNEDEEVVPIAAVPSEWDDEDDDQQQSSVTPTNFESKSVINLSSLTTATEAHIHSPPRDRPTDRISLCSASSQASSASTDENRPNSSTSKRSSNLKKSDRSSTRVKSPKSVTFNLGDRKNSTAPIPTPSYTANEITTPLLAHSQGIFKEKSDLIPDLFKQHYTEVTTKSNIGYKLGNALTNVRIHEIEEQNGDYLCLLNISNTEDYDLSGHFLQQNMACVPLCRFRFPINTIIKAGQTVTIWCGTMRDIEPQPPHVFVWKEQRKWETGPECITILAKPTGQAIAWARSSNRINTDQTPSDVSFANTRSNLGTVDSSTITSSTFNRNRSRLSAFHFIGNPKASFIQSSMNPTHADHQGTNPNDFRSQLHQTAALSQLLNRPKSSPFASHPGCKQDLISRTYLTKQPAKPTTIKT